MDVYSHSDYKELIRARVAELQTVKSLTFKTIAAQIPVQYTYFSKFLNDSKTHLNEAHLLKISRILDFFHEETDYLLLLRARDCAGDAAHREYLNGKLERLRHARKLDASVQEFTSSNLSEEMRYLFDPFCTLIYVALHIPAFKSDPKRLCIPLGLTSTRLKEILRAIQNLKLIQLDHDGLTIKKILKNRIHYGRDHPMTRTHQMVMRSLIQPQLMKTPEDQKESFLVSFTMDEEGFKLAQKEFQSFVRSIQEIARRSTDQHLYQLSFDLFRWL